MILMTEGRGVVLRPNGLKSTNKTFLFLFLLVVRCPSDLGYGQEGRVDQKHHHGRVLGPLELAAIT